MTSSYQLINQGKFIEHLLQVTVEGV